MAFKRSGVRFPLPPLKRVVDYQRLFFVDNDQVERYIAEAQKVTFAASGDPNLLARANRLIDSAFSQDSDIFTTAMALRDKPVTYQKKSIVPSLMMGELLGTESKEIVRNLFMVVPCT